MVHHETQEVSRIAKMIQEVYITLHTSNANSMPINQPSHTIFDPPSNLPHKRA